MRDGDVCLGGLGFLERGDKPALVISTCEALVVLLVSKLFSGDVSRNTRTQIQMISSFSDDRGNGSALNKLMTTKFLSSGFVVELACLLTKDVHQGHGGMGAAHNKPRGEPAGEWDHFTA